jgi:hypothetical protein
LQWCNFAGGQQHDANFHVTKYDSNLLCPTVVLYSFNIAITNTGTQGPCQPGKVFVIDPEDLQPRCQSLETSQYFKEDGTKVFEGAFARYGVTGMLELYKPCTPGSFRDFRGECRTAWKFMF